MSLKLIDKNIKLVATNGAKLNLLIHATAMLVVQHAKEHGDCTRALTLVKAMPASMRRTMLVLWFSTYTPIRVVDKNDKVGILKENAKGYTPWDLEGADATPFYDLAEQNPEGKVLDFAALVALVSRLSKQIDKKIEEGKVEAADVESAKAISVAIAGLKFERVKPTDRADPNNIKLIESQDNADEPVLGGNNLMVANG
jgi:hypothetical protein